MPQNSLNELDLVIAGVARARTLFGRALFLGAALEVFNLCQWQECSIIVVLSTIVCL